jgi:hypothetical protein
MTDTYACGITMDRPKENLYELLGLEPLSGHNDIHLAGRRLLEEGMSTAQRYAWKALADPCYRRVYEKTQDSKDLYRAGFFDDGLPQLAMSHKAWDPVFMTTPLEKVRKHFIAWLKSDRSREPIVLVTTGGMAPIHNGHIAMMDEARKIAEDQGYSVLGGYFAPGHDSYVGQKYGGTAAIPAEHRCSMVELATQESNWLDCDPWAARYMPAEINFTDVVMRLQEYLKFHVGQYLRVFYVYGSDNEGFGEALPGQSIMIPRSDISSKLAREGNHDHLNTKVRDYLLTWDKQDTGELPYLIRNEENLAIRRWHSIIDESELEKRRIQLQSTVRLGIAQVFKSLGHQNKVHLIPVSEQLAQAEKVVGDRLTLSLDPFFPGDEMFQSTRYFAVSEAQRKPQFRAERVGFPFLEEQAQNIPDGEYVLVEDDTVTGGTIRSALDLLPQGVKIVDQVILSDFGDYAGTEYYDVVDLRDFIVGSDYGGLSVILGSGAKARVPYAAPYVSLRARAKIPAAAELEISRIIWQANVRFFKNTDIKIRHCDLGFQEFASYLGFEKDTLMEEFCHWHVGCLLEPHLFS